jgi:hypothetical protein
MNFTIEDKGKYTLVTSNVDKLDTTCAPELKSELVYLNKTGVRNVHHRPGHTRYCDSSGLSALLVANRLCKSVNGSAGRLRFAGARAEAGTDLTTGERPLHHHPEADLLYMEERRQGRPALHGGDREGREEGRRPRSARSL